MTAFSPGQSPPPVRIATFISPRPPVEPPVHPPGYDPPEIDRPVALAQGTFAVRSLRLGADDRGARASGPRAPARRHLHDPGEELPLGVHAPPAVLPRPVEAARALEPHAGADDAVEGERRDDLVGGRREVGLYSTIESKIIKKNRKN